MAMAMVYLRSDRQSPSHLGLSFRLVALVIAAQGGICPPRTRWSDQPRPVATCHRVAARLGARAWGESERSRCEGDLPRQAIACRPPTCEMTTASVIDRRPTRDREADHSVMR